MRTMNSKRKVKVIRAKKWKTEEALETAIRAYLDCHPDSDQLDVADACGISLRRACEVLDRLVAAAMVRIT
jgi:hypothetical protein